MTIRWSSLCISAAAMLAIRELEAFTPSTYKNSLLGINSATFQGLPKPLLFDCSQPGTKEQDLPPLTHHEIVWKIRPSEGTPKEEAIKLQAQAKLLRLEYTRQNIEPPLILCPPGPLILLEAHLDNRRIGRFGITIQRGPMATPIAETIENVYGIKTTAGIGIAALKYMFVEPKFRKRNVGQLAIEVIALIHATVGCDFTLLVADDKSDERTLVKWYEANGFIRAPLLQNLLGSPNEECGVTMIAPTQGQAPKGLRIEWW